MIAAVVDIIAAPWRLDPVGFFWIFVMGSLVASTCGLLGCYLLLRRHAMLGDAISHAILPGIVVAAVFTHSLVGPQILVGAIIAAFLCVAIIHLIYRFSKVKEDAATGIAFTTLFALGIIGVSLFAGDAHLDLECVLYGELEYIPFEPRTDELILVSLLPEGQFTEAVRPYSEIPRPVILMAITAFISLLGIILFYKELLLASFDGGMAYASGISPVLVHYCIMAMTAMTAVSAFQAVGAILVVAMLILPGATAYLLTDRLPRMLLISGLLGPVYSWAAMTLALSLPGGFAISTAGAMVLVGFVGFLAAWLFSPSHGLIAGWLRRRKTVAKLDMTEIERLLGKSPTAAPLKEG